MIVKGSYKLEDTTYGIIVKHTKKEVEVLLVKGNELASAYKHSGGEEYSFLSNKAKNLWGTIRNGLVSCTVKNGYSIPFVLGSAVRHEFAKARVEYIIDLFNGEICGCSIYDDVFNVQLSDVVDDSYITKNIPYVKLTRSAYDLESMTGGDNIRTRTIAEIALDKEDITWLNNKKYYIVNDDTQAERIFTYLDNYGGVIAYDTETTGLKINCFGKVNSSYQKELLKWNEENPDDTIRADKLVGIIFCVENDVSYYFPCGNRKFKNLYDKSEGNLREKTINNIKARYTVGEFRAKEGDMADYVRNTSNEDFTPDVILMERVRNILETKHIVAHNGSFEWKVGWQYEIDTNLKDDTMILHQIMYKFRSTTSNRGEPSNLKYLAKVELGIEQWELEDFFPDFKPDKKGTVRNKGKENSIDFSYMDYAGTKIYAPTDGDVTYQLYMKYKRDMVTNHKEQEYLYNVEVIVSCAVAYMEFYGHRLDEEKIAEVRDKFKAQRIMTISEIRQSIGYSSDKEKEIYTSIKNSIERLEKAEKEKDRDSFKKELHSLNSKTEKLNDAIEDNVDKVINLASPAQVSELFYDVLKMPFSGDKKSVASKAIKPLLKAKDEHGNNKYPIVHLYSKYKSIDTLLTKFFENLTDFMYPGGFIFSSYGQISTATGRMSCRQPKMHWAPIW